MVHFPTAPICTKIAQIKAIEELWASTSFVTVDPVYATLCCRLNVNEIPKYQWGQTSIQYTWLLLQKKVCEKWKFFISSRSSARLRVRDSSPAPWSQLLPVHHVFHATVTVRWHMAAKNSVTCTATLPVYPPMPDRPIFLVHTQDYPCSLIGNVSWFTIRL